VNWGGMDMVVEEVKGRRATRIAVDLSGRRLPQEAEGDE
jgi:hypothetical protein